MKRGVFPDKSYDEKIAALEKSRARQRAKLVGKTSERPRIKQQSGLKPKSRKSKSNESLEREFKRRCRQRDGDRCRWTEENGSRCPVWSSVIAVHHINEKSQRPDLRFDPDNGACICPIHHDYMHHTVAGRERGRELKLLGGETYEKAMKEQL